MKEGPATNLQNPVRVVGRYALYEEIASGGMATVHFGRLLGPVGFSRTVAIKRLHPQFAKDPEFVSMFLDEARLAARIRHPNVVPTLDVVATAGELFLVMDYVQGESLSRLVRMARDMRVHIAPSMVATIMAGMLSGLHAAHEAKSERGEPLNIVHRDISPQNVLVGSDGIPRILDFGVAKAAGRIQTTREGQLKGKLAYMAPEQLEGDITRKVDIYAASVVMWEALTGQRLFTGDSEAAILGKVLSGTRVPPSSLMSGSREPPEVLRALDAVVLKGLERDPAGRFATARDMASEIERAIRLAPTGDVGEWVERTAKVALGTRAHKIAEIESSSSVNVQVDGILSAIQDGSDTIRPEPNSGAGQTPLESTSTQFERIQRQNAKTKIIWWGAVPTILVLGGLLAFASFARRPDVNGGRGTSDDNASRKEVLGRGELPSPPSATASSVEPAPTTSATTSATASSTQTVAPPRPTVRPTPRPTPPKPPATNNDDCKIPYTIDQKGMKHFKPQCLK